MKTEHEKKVKNEDEITKKKSINHLIKKPIKWMEFKFKK
jgi:hypothetical protein